MLTFCTFNSTSSEPLDVQASERGTPAPRFGDEAATAPHPHSGTSSYALGVPTSQAGCSPQIQTSWHGKVSTIYPEQSLTPRPTEYTIEALHQLIRDTYLKTGDVEATLSRLGISLQQKRTVYRLIQDLDKSPRSASLTDDAMLKLLQTILSAYRNRKPFERLDTLEKTYFEKVTTLQDKRLSDDQIKKSEKEANNLKREFQRLLRNQAPKKIAETLHITEAILCQTLSAAFDVFPALKKQDDALAASLCRVGFHLVKRYHLPLG